VAAAAAATPRTTITRRVCQSGIIESADHGEEHAMARFVTIGYGDEAGYRRTAAEVRDAAHAHDARLVEDGVEMGIAGTPVQVRNHDAAGVRTEQGAFMTSALPVAGFAVIEAETLADAVEIASRTPCAVAQGVVEVWPLDPSG
jgi:hypothetical protein